MKKTIKITAIICIIAIVCTVLLSSCGFFGAKAAMSYDNYKISKNMMRYYLGNYYNTFIKQQYDLYSQYSVFLDTSNFEEYMEKYIGFNPYKPLDEQEYKKDTDDSIKTWQDYFTYQTTEMVKQYLIYRAEAIKLGVELDDNDRDKIDKKIENLLEALHSYYATPSDSQCLAKTYGKGVTVNDIRDAVELSIIAGKAAEKMGENIEDEITVYRIEDTYNKSKKEFDLVDHLSYSFEIDYADIVEEVAGKGKTHYDLTLDQADAVYKKYTEKIQKAREAAAEIAKATTYEEFKAYILLNLSDSSKNDSLNSMLNSLIPNSDNISEDILNSLKVKLLAETIKKTESDPTENQEVAESLKMLDSMIVYEKSGYGSYDTDEKYTFSEWALSADRKVGDTKVIETLDGETVTDFDGNKKGKFEITVNMITKPAYRDDSFSYDVAYMCFINVTDANKAIEALNNMSSLNKEKFIAFAEDESNNASIHAAVDAYCLGNMQSKDFDNWLLSAKEGEITKAPISLSGYYTVVYYIHAGKLKAWQETVKAAIYDKDYTAYEQKITEDYESNIVIDQDVINEIKIGTVGTEKNEGSFIDGIISSIIPPTTVAPPPASSGDLADWGITVEGSGGSSSASQSPILVPIS